MPSPKGSKKLTENNRRKAESRAQALTEIAAALGLTKDDGSPPGPTTFVTHVIRAWRDGGEARLHQLFYAWAHGVEIADVVEIFEDSAEAESEE